MLRDPDGNVARRAAISLYELRRKRLPEELIYRALSVAGYQPGDTVPGSAWKEAGSVAGYRWQLMMTFEFRRLLEDVTATQRLVEAADPDSLLAVFRWAAVVLAEGRSRQGVDHLMTLLTHERESVRTWVAGILNVAGPYATQRCLAVLDSDDGTHSDWERVGAARALVEQVRNARAWIEHGLAKDPAFGSLRGPGDDDVAGELAYLSDVVPPVLKRLADDRVSEVRRIAEEGLALFGLAQALRTDDAQ
jgi:hypothetical protein